MAVSTKLLGRWGEAKAAEMLKRKGYRIIAMGYRTRFGELDIIAQKKNMVVFVEVKLRKNDRFAKAMEYVDSINQERLKATARLWMSERGEEVSCRFDVVEIYAPEGMNTEVPVINHIENAF